eukprot:scaffold171653_cov29-Tisochrysis_lutea.AAC.2
MTLQLALSVGLLALSPRAPLLRPPRAAARAGDGAQALDGSLAPSLSELWGSYNQALVTSPLVTKAITAGVIIGAGDTAAQLIESRGARFDGARALRWAAFGLLLQGPWNHFFYQLLDGSLPPTPSPFTLVTLEKVGIDQFIQAPIFTMIILLFFAVVEGKGIAYARDQIKNELGGILVKNWSVFLPATVINISFCPPELRVLFLNCVFFGWVIYLSLFLNQNTEVEGGR